MKLYIVLFIGICLYGVFLIIYNVQRNCVNCPRGTRHAFSFSNEIPLIELRNQNATLPNIGRYQQQQQQQQSHLLQQQQQQQQQQQSQHQQQQLTSITNSDGLSSRIRAPTNNLSVLVWVMTYPRNIMNAVFINRTWGKRVDKLLFVSDSFNRNLPSLNMSFPEGRAYLVMKTMAAFDYVYKHYGNSYDWFMKADDDTYVIVENLRYFLSDKNPKDPVYFGHMFKTVVTQGYHSGGAGYVLSREALTRFGQRAAADCDTKTIMEDLYMGRCLEKVGVKAGETLDEKSRTRFHCFRPGTHLRGGHPDWFVRYDKYEGKKQGQVSDYTVSFHYLTVPLMEDLEFYLYHLKVYGE